MKSQNPKDLHEDRRRQLWIGVAIAVARSDMPMDSDTPVRYANTALDAFDKRFKVEEEIVAAPTN